MNKKLLLLLTVIFFISIIIAGCAFAKVNDKRQVIIVCLKNEADIEISKKEVSKIPHVKWINVKFRDKEWSKFVNKYDPRDIDNPFKNELIIKVDKQSNLEKGYNEVQNKDFAEKVVYSSDRNYIKKVTFWK